MNILIIEDFHPMVKALKEVLEGQGHNVVGVVGFTDVEAAQAIDLSGRQTNLVLEDIDLALVDGQLEGDFHGPAVVARLTKASVVAIGMSTEEKLNSEMESNGANCAFNKAIVFAAVSGGLVKVEDIVSGQQCVVQALSELRDNFRTSQNDDLRHKADELLKRHLS